MKDYLLKRPMLISAILCIITSVIGFYFGKAVIFIGFIYAVLIGIFIFKKINPQLILALLFVIIMLTSTLFTLNKADSLSRFDGDTLKTEATVCEITHQNEEFSSAVMQINDSRISINGAKVLCFFEPCRLSIGQNVKAEFEFKTTQNSPYKNSNYSENIFLTANLHILTVNEDKNDFVLTFIDNVRNYIKSSLFKNTGYEEASTLSALVFGEKSYFTNEFYNNVARAGVSHVMVVSGMHLSILILFFLNITERLFYNKYVKAIIIALVVILLTALCGFTMSILRAGITYLVIAFSIIIKRKHTPANSLGTATVIIMTFSPFAIFSIALQLSLLSTFGILSIATPVIDYCKSRSLIKSHILSELFYAVIITISALITTLPVTIYIFGFVSTVAVITNLLISYAVTAALSIAVLALIANAFLPFLAKLLFFVCEIIVKYINFIINFFGSLPFSVAVLPKSTVIFSIILIIIIFYALLACKKRLDMIKLDEIRAKNEKKGGKRLKWQ